MAKWDRTTRQAWEKSVVAQEFEKNILELSRKLEMMSQASINDKAKQIQTSLGDAEKSLDSLLHAAGETSLANDGESEIKEVSEEEKAKKAQASLLEELRLIAEAAIDLGDIKLAYRIERTISELLGE